MNTTTSTVQITVTEFLQTICQMAFDGRSKVAIWRKPGGTQVEVALDSSAGIKKVPTQLEKLPAGFILHPFAGQENDEAYFIPAESYFRIDISQARVDDVPDEVYRAHSQNTGTGSSAVARALREYSGMAAENLPSPTRRRDFLAMVNEAKRAIADGKLFKVVAARTKEVTLNQDFNFVSTFFTLCNSYPNSFVNFFHIPKVGTWIGATPEVLIQTRGTLFKTMALAGTQKARGKDPIRTTGWTQKEIEEQALVSRYIVSCFKKIRLREYDEIGPRTSMAGNLLHLKSDFIVDMDATSFPDLGSVMLNLLHPTSAVGGMPREKALAFIRDHEQFDRSFFAGFLGPVNIGAETNVYVNLRCAQICGDKAILYAGAGITAESVPEKEWQETEMKCEIVGKHLLNPS